MAIGPEGGPMAIKHGLVGEDDCVVCAEWPSEAREYLRWFICALPMADVGNASANGCLLAFWDNSAHRPKPDPFFFPDIGPSLGRRLPPRGWPPSTTSHRRPTLAADYLTTRADR